jgi:hypothetical protein
MEIRVIDRDSRRWLQQYRYKPGGFAHELEWQDVCELPRLGVVRKLMPKPR